MMVEAMSTASLDRLLAILLAGAIGTGFVTLHAGGPADAWVFTLHDLFAGTLLVAVLVKLRRSVPRAVFARRWRRLLAAAPLIAAAAGALAGGYLWVANGAITWIDLAGGRCPVTTAALSRVNCPHRTKLPVGHRSTKNDCLSGRRLLTYVASIPLSTRSPVPEVFARTCSRPASASMTWFRRMTRPSACG